MEQQNIRNTSLEQEIKELQMSIKKNELSIKNQKLEIEKTTNDIEIKKKKYEQECEEMKLKLIEEKNKKINNYLIETYNFREKIADKRYKLQSSLISEMNSKNEIEVRKNSLIIQKRKNMEENIHNQYLELEKIKHERELEQINKERHIKEKMDNELLSQINILNEKRRIENVSDLIIERMEDFLNKKMDEFDKIQSQKVLESESNWNNFCLEFKQKSNDQLQKVFIDSGDYRNQFDSYLKFYS